jgi:RNA polymerase sigma factor (sigma-70 family)
VSDAQESNPSRHTHDADEFLFKAALIIPKIVRSQLSDGRRRLPEYDIDDLTQEILLKLIQSFSSYDQSKPLDPWVARVVINTCRDRKRRARLRYTVEIGQIALGQVADQLDVPEHTNAQEEASRLLAVISSSARLIVRLRFWEGFTYEKIAKMTKRTPASVKMQLSRVLHGFKKHAK